MVIEAVAGGEYSLTLRSGAAIGDNHVVLRVLNAASACAITYLVHDAAQQRPAVAKEFLPRALVARAAAGAATVRAHSADTEREFARALRRFAREGELLVDLVDRALPAAERLVEANGTAYLVMRHYDVAPVAERFAPGERLSPAAGVRLVSRVLDALQRLHEEGVLHRDVSPRTVHLDDDGEPLLLGLGAWRHLSGQPREPDAGFMPLEQYAGKDVGPWTDVYGCAALLYDLLCGTPPTPALERAAGTALRPPTAFVPDLPPSLVTVVMRALALAPAGRPHGAAELRRQLADALTATSVVELRPEARVEPRPEPRSTPPRPLEPMRPRLVAPATAPESEEEEDASEKSTSDFELSPLGVVIPREGGDVLARGLSLIRSAAGAAAGLGRRRPGASALPTEAAPGAVPEASDTEQRTEATPAGQPRAGAPEESAAASSLDPAFSAGQMVLHATARTPAPLDALQLAELAREVDAHARSVRPRRRIFAVGGILLVASAAVAGVLSGGSRTTSANAGRSNDALASPLVAIPDPTPPVPGMDSAGSAAAVLQGGERPARAAAAGSTSVERVAASATRATSSSRGESRRDEAPAAVPVLTAPTISIPPAAAGLQLVPPEALVDLRSRLAVARDETEQGDYADARRTLAAAMRNADSLSAKIGESTTLRALRQDLEAAARRSLDACAAENEMRRKRGGQAVPCS